MSEVRRVRVCPSCGSENPTRASDCATCGLDILGEPVETRIGPAPAPPPPVTAATGGDATLEAPAVAVAQPVTGPRVVLEPLQNPSLRFEIGDGQVVGRSEQADVPIRDLPNVDTVSRRMARFFRRGEQWFVQHVGSTNFVTVDGDRYEGDEEVALHDGSVLGLALCQFIVRIPEAS